MKGQRVCIYLQVGDFRLHGVDFVVEFAFPERNVVGSLAESFGRVSLTIARARVRFLHETPRIGANALRPRSLLVRHRVVGIVR